MLRFNRR